MGTYVWQRNGPDTTIEGSAANPPWNSTFAVGQLNEPDGGGPAVSKVLLYAQFSVEQLGPPSGANWKEPSWWTSMHPSAGCILDGQSALFAHPIDLRAVSDPRVVCSEAMDLRQTAFYPNAGGLGQDLSSAQWSCRTESHAPRDNHGSGGSPAIQAGILPSFGDAFDWGNTPGITYAWRMRFYLRVLWHYR